MRTLAQLTRNVAVVQYPSLSRSRIRHFELVTLSSTRLMLVLITDTGRVEQRIVELPAEVADAAVFDLRATLNAQLRDRLLSEAAELVTELPPHVEPQLQGLLITLTSVLLEVLVEPSNDRILLGGTANLTERSLGLPGDPPGARGTRGTGRPAPPAGRVGGVEQDRRRDR